MEARHGASPSGNRTSGGRGTLKEKLIKFNSVIPAKAGIH